MMKYKQTIMLCASFLPGLAIGTVKAQSQDKGQSNGYEAVGSAITADEVLGAANAWELFETLKESDTLASVFSARVVEVCQVKGCWMRLAMPDGQQVMVQFKDYGFFVPTDIAGREVAVGGIAYLALVSEEERRHLAEDAGKSEAEINAITGPAMEPRFQADGVRIYQ